ncbi:MAG: ERCC4 domain-containing protein [Clostridia bacterium]|nr:ERCC4 domain-containing protein [Clostridia bacterium]
MSYTPFELERMLESMVVLVDTREQPGKRFDRRMEGIGCPFIRSKLDFGDYSCQYIDLNGDTVRMDKRIAIERKMDGNELALCFGKERARFEREFERAKMAGASLYLIVEGENWEKTYAGKYGMSDKFRSRFSPKAMIASLNAWESRYDLHVRFCKAETTGRMIRDILYYRLKEVLQHG